MSKPLSFQIILPVPMDNAIERFTAALKTEGFGVITRIDNHKVFKEKLGVDFRPYVILGVCNPKLAHDAINVDASVGLFLPCKATVEAVDEGTLISIVNPEIVLQQEAFQDTAIVTEFAPEARARLLRVIEALQA